MSFFATKTGTTICRVVSVASLALATATVLMLAALLPGVHASDSGEDAQSSDKTSAPVAVVAENFNDGKPDDKAFTQNCYPCHQVIKSRDFVFARYAP